MDTQLSDFYQSKITFKNIHHAPASCVFYFTFTKVSLILQKKYF